MKNLLMNKKKKDIVKHPLRSSVSWDNAGRSMALSGLDSRLSWHQKEHYLQADRHDSKYQRVE